ncbi:ABC transporter substrate-binding protein [Pseudomonas typographi]|uniref:ABC transporter substrate-binding protein n=1 Tax=Pseudomonas typographi TaxID=2715964 RepID=A0ABR7Z0U4_9PSED|nr:ABC transporter substrate-binding protein [Pseudomonas typographi]MBD1599098.1 ABC transporter substrate-binding protein [Pseudomonas typographi]
MITSWCKALVATLLLSVTVVHAETAPAVIRIGVPDLSTNAKPYAPGLLGIVQQRQQLEQAFAAGGTRIEWRFFRGAGPAINEAFANGQLDFAALGDLAAIIGRASGLDTRLLMGMRGTHLFLASTPEAAIHSVADLKGKRIALYRGTADQLSFDRVLAGAGLSEKDLQIINLDWTAAAAALLAGQVDATWSNLNLLKLRDRGIEINLSTKSLPLLATTQGGVVASQAFLSQYPEATQRVVDQLVSDAVWLQQPEHYEQYLVEQEQVSGIPAALAREESAGADLTFRYSPRFDTFLTASFSQSIEQAKALGLIRRPFKVGEWFAPQFVEAALRKQSLQALWPDYDEQGRAITAPAGS